MIAGVDRRDGPLQALARYYDRMSDAEAPGWSREKFGWAVVIDGQGEPIDVKDLRDLSGKKPVTQPYVVPASFPRPGTTPRAFFLWDKTAFALGVTKSASGGGWEATPRQHEAFRALHLERLGEAVDEGLVALRRFIERWTPERFDSSPFRADMIDANIMFRLEGDASRFIQDRPAARRLVESQVSAFSASDDREAVLCLVTGERAPAVRLHPTIKGVEGAQTAGGSLVSFNLEAFESYGQVQGENAPTSEAAAFRYGAALNRLLARDSRNRVKRPIGDATVIFWADASDAKAADAADFWVSQALSMEIEDAAEARKIGEQLDAVAAGRPLSSLDPSIKPGTRFHVLGLSPNAARLSVRFWFSDDLDEFAKHLAEHHTDLKLEPSPWRRPPSINFLLAQTTALQGKFDNIPPQLAGEVTRAILTGAQYPYAWLAAVMIRLRAGDDPASGWHASAIRAVLSRAQRQKRKNRHVPEEGETPMGLDREHPSIGYQLGRLFAVYERAQRLALGRGVKSTVRDKYFGAASATPASVFPVIISNGQHHLARGRKDRPGLAVLIERELDEIMGHITPRLPRSLRLEAQGEFAIGYYHQRTARLGDGTIDEPTADETSEEGDETND